MKLFQAFNDFYAIVFTIILFTFWGVGFWFKWEISVIMAGTSPLLVLVVQYYFRKKNGNGNNGST